MAGYTTEQKALAVEVIAREGGLTREAVSTVRQLLNAPGLSKSTLHGWWVANRTEPNRTEPIKKNVIPTPVRQQASDSLDDIFEHVARLYLERAAQDSVVSDTKGKDAVITAATAVDKMRLLRGLPTEIVQLTIELYDALGQAGLDPVTTFNKMIQRAHEHANSRPD